MRYKVKIFFRDETDRVHRKDFEFKTGNISESLYELFKWAEKFGAETIVFNKKEKQ